ncbi:hypothetical protein UlMin_037761, partial [Ulmus minor]
SALKSIAKQFVDEKITKQLNYAVEDMYDEIDNSLCQKNSSPSSSSNNCGTKYRGAGSHYAKGNSYNRYGTDPYMGCVDNNPKTPLFFTTNVKCSCDNGTCHVTEINWASKGLVGAIPNEFGYLTYLQKLDLSSNSLEGTIPDIWDNMSSLYMLNLLNNNLTGEIPKSLGNLKPRINEMRCMEFILDLRNNQLEGKIPATMGDLERHRDLIDNCSCSNFFVVGLSSNYLTGKIPEGLGNKFLTHLWLDWNMLNKLPQSLSNMTSLRSLYLTGNQLSGPIPPALVNLQSLEQLYLGSNNFTDDLPETLSQLKNLMYFSIAGSNLFGPFPKFITKWRNITTLNLAGNNFWGNIPPEILSLTYIRYLIISDIANSSFKFPHLDWTKIRLVTLVLRNCSVNGSIPEDIGLMPSLYRLDLSFNELTGTIPSSLRNASSLEYLYLGENKLSGTIPDWVPAAVNNNSGRLTDLSFNDFSNSNFKFDPKNTNLNLFSCCRSCSSSTCDNAPQMKNVSEYTKNVCRDGKPKTNSLHINCGGEETKVNGIIYENDNDTSPVYTSPHGNWARISSGEQSTVGIKCGIFISNGPLFDRARVASVYMTYYGFCLEEGYYNVTLYFAEIQFANNTEDEDDGFNDGSQSLRKRIFNINIQNQWSRTDFNIKETADGAKKDISVGGIVHVNNSRLEIHLYWAGKGSYTYTSGPLISAISVVRSDPKEKLSPLKIALISTASVLAVGLLLLVIAWKMGWLEKEEIQEIRVGQNKTVTLKQLVSATRGFSEEMKIGKGGLGTVYKAELADKQIVAVKRLTLSSLSSEGLNKLKSELYALAMYSDEHLVQLFDHYIGKGYYLLIYEYMENKSLGDALFDEESKNRPSWEARFNICLGIASGLQYLHEHPRLKMVHRGIKAVNILLDSDLKPKISDFGLASFHVEDDQGAGVLKIIKKDASHGYMAPEYPSYGMISDKYDVYSYGVVILELVSGKQNARNKNNQELEFLVDE